MAIGDAEPATGKMNVIDKGRTNDFDPEVPGSNEHRQVDTTRQLRFLESRLWEKSMTNGNGHVGIKVEPGWFDFARQMIMFLMGIAILIYAVVTTGHDIPFIVAGLVLLGIVPIDRFLTRIHVPDEDSSTSVSG